MHTPHINFQDWTRHELSARLRVWADRAKSRLAARPALLPGAVCYAAILGLVIYNLAVHARLDSWRQPVLHAAPLQPAAAISPAGADSCAQFAGMGQRLCSAEAKFEVTRARFQQKVEARKQRVRMSLGMKSAERVASAPLRPAQADVTPAYVPEQAEPAKPSLATRE